MAEKNGGPPARSSPPRGRSAAGSAGAAVPARARAPARPPGSAAAADIAARTGPERRATASGPPAAGAPRADPAAPRPDCRPPDAPRRPELGLRALGALVPRLTRPAFRRRSPAGAALMTDWASLVGPSLAAVTSPLRLTRGTLTIACSGPMAMELQHLGPQLMARINAALGAVTVESLRFVQQAPASAAPPPPRPPPPAPLPEAVAARLEGVADPALRAALERLAQGVYRRR